MNGLLSYAYPVEERESGRKKRESEGRVRAANISGVADSALDSVSRALPAPGFPIEFLASSPREHRDRHADEILDLVEFYDQFPGNHIGMSAEPFTSAREVAGLNVFDTGPVGAGLLRCINWNRLVVFWRGQFPFSFV